MTVPEQIDQRHQEDLQRLRGFRLLDDDFLTKCFEGNTASIELVLQIVLKKPDLKVLDVRTQVFVENLLNRSVRLDILATDSTGAKLNVEVQRSDKGAGRKRARYYSSMMDANLLMKGEDFDQLPETWVIFITENDVIGKGVPIYPIERCFLETGEIFEDGSHILNDIKNPNHLGLGNIKKSISVQKGWDMKGVSMCRAMEDMRNQTLKEGMKEVALRMLVAGKYALEEIVNISGLSLEEVKQLKADGRS